MNYSLREATPDEISRWDKLILANPSGGDILQSSFFATIKAAAHWRARYMVYEGENHKIAALFLELRIPLLGKLWYCPAGPGVVDAEQLAAVTAANLVYAQARKDIFLLQLEPSLPKATPLPSDLLPAHKNLQPHAATACIINFPETSDELFAFYTSKERTRIRKAQKSGITVRPVPCNQQNLQKFFDLYITTGERNQFFVRPRSYYWRFWQTFCEGGHGQLFFAEKDGQLLCGGFAIWLGRLGYYKDSGSVRGQPLLHAPHLLQWEMQRWLIKRGVHRYEMMGVPPQNRLNDPSHAFYNVGVFKQSFSPTITDLVGTLNQVVNLGHYRIWQMIGQKIMNRLARHVWHDSLY